MKLSVLGGGPTGLYFAISMKLRDPAHQITVYERNRADDTFGWGVVLSDETLAALARNDPASAEAIRSHFAYWDDIRVVRGDEEVTTSGHGFCGIGRLRLLQVLQARAAELGVDIRYEHPVDDAECDRLRRESDLVIAADGLNSRLRTRFADAFCPDVEIRRNKFVWLGTRQTFANAFTFLFEQTEHGWIWAHAYQFDAETATFIAECSEKTWTAFGFGAMSKEENQATLERLFARHLGGHALLSNAHHIRGSAWINFPRVVCGKWHHENMVLLGDASATAHFSIGSGSKLGMESAIALAERLNQPGDLAAQLDAYQAERALDVLRLQSAARNSTEWFEDVERYLGLDMMQFNYSLLTRSQRISHENLRQRDPAWLAEAEGWFQRRAGSNSQRRPMFAPFTLRDLTLKNRVVVSPMAQYKAVDGTPTDWHLVHYAERAKGGAGLVMTEMTCISAEGRITPGCPGLYAPEHEAAWRRITDFVHAETGAAICCQIGHAGRKGSTRIGWEGMDKPLPEGNWPLLSASALPWSADNATPAAITAAQMEAITAQFVAATQMAERAGFDMVELHAAHGYLLSAFLSPASNQRTDAWGGSLENRLRWPLDVFAAMRAAWPPAKPMSVRISATDWLGEDGVTPQEAVQIAAAFRAAGADIVDVSAGQTSTAARPVYGRMFQTPFSDRIRNQGGIPTMAVGNITEPDHVNSILLAGRADLVCIARPHLADPYWTLHAAVALGERDEGWPLPYLAGRDQAERLATRAP
ncbi:MAG TPA: bifunctional salicylyl-CoA 5-hydroxylase/oxidoreductase [Novosphingobium sp.]|nr:bifunctional salicylyl-CoA 5-hydroxylase/oxidoreductase [Novosphingobium sp.]